MPKLKAIGAAARHLANICLEESLEFNDGSVHDQRGLAVCQLLVQIYQLIDAEDMCLSPRAAAQIPDIGFDFLILYNFMRDIYNELEINQLNSISALTCSLALLAKAFKSYPPSSIETTFP